MRNEHDRIQSLYYEDDCSLLIIIIILTPSLYNSCPNNLNLILVSFSCGTAFCSFLLKVSLLLVFVFLSA
jgi:hypothetical protein